jgi:hypothetical protein
MRACKLKNIATGKVISAKSIAAFCKKVGLIGNERYHLTPVLDGERIHHKGWTTPEKYAELYKAREWKDIYGNYRVLSLIEIYQIFGKETLITAGKFLSGKNKSINGLYPSDYEINHLPPKNYKIKSYKFNKNGKIVSGRTVRELSEKLGISNHSIWDVIYGKREKCKGMTFNSIETEQKSIV